MLTSRDLQRFINENHIAAEILPMAHDTPTVPDAARALGVSQQQIIKSLVFLVAESNAGVARPVLVIANGARKVDERLVAGHLGVGRKRVKLARPEQALAITGYIVGAMPPFGHQTRLRTLVDPGVVAQPEVYGGGGEINAMLRLTSRELVRVAGAEVVSVAT
jgi:prolyl-tRNA editing enzyme YbaK/EbsC (Cys-tRNA(Pro) deacylase)